MQKKVGLFRSTLPKSSPYARKSRTFCSKVDHLTNSECQVSRTFLINCIGFVTCHFLLSHVIRHPWVTTYVKKKSDFESPTFLHRVRVEVFKSRASKSRKKKSDFQSQTFLLHRVGLIQKNTHKSNICPCDMALTLTEQIEIGIANDK